MNEEIRDETIHLYGTHVLKGTDDDGNMLIRGGKKGCVYKVIQSKNRTPEDIRKIREDTGMTLDEFASLLGTNAASIKQWESGEKDPGKTVSRLLDMLEQDENILDLFVEEG